MPEPFVDPHGPPNLHIHLLGEFAVWVRGILIPAEQWHSRRARNLVKLLALTLGHHLHRDQITEMLWPESDLAASANNFHQTLHAARQILRQAGPGILVLEEGCLHLLKGDPARLRVDVDQFEAAAAVIAAGRDSQPGAEVYQSALDLYPGDLLPDDIYEAWAAPRRDGLRQMYIQLLLDLARRDETCGEYPAGIAALQRLLLTDPCHEAAHAGLMRLYALSGQRQQALRQYQTLREVLQREIAVEPSPETTRLYADIQAGRFSISAQAQTPARLPESGRSPRHNLPHRLSTFIGREKEIGQVICLLSSTRLLTVTGAGGVGKTSLALQAAGRLIADFPDGVFLIELAALADPNLVAQTCAQALEVIPQPGIPVQAVLTNYLTKKHLLLILDNCEHALSACTPLVNHLLTACPRLHILATSRAILSVPGEHPYRVPSLTLPDPQAVPPLEELAQYEAVRLFAERARQAAPDFVLTETNASAVTQICQRLDGIPLAIELAAARTRMLAVEQIAARLDHAFHLLTGGSPAVLPRQQTLQATIDWSYNLLTPKEALLLQRLAVFAGGWTLEAAEQVCADGDQIAPSEVLDLLGNQVDKSMVLVQSREPQARYRLLETVRQCARERLVERGEEAVVRERHLDYFLMLAQQAEPHLRAWGANLWLDRLEGELDNLRLALDWSLTVNNEKGLQLGTALLWFWKIRGHSLEGAEWLERLLQVQANQPDFPILPLPDQVARGRAMNTLSYIILVNSAFPHHLLDLKKALDIETKVFFQKLFDEFGEAYNRDYAISLLNQAHTVEELLECRDLFRAINDIFWTAECDMSIAEDLPVIDDRGYQYGLESLALRKEIGDRDGEGGLLFIMSAYELCRGNEAKAVEMVKEAAACSESVGNRLWAAMMRSNLAFFVLEHYGDYDEVNRLSELSYAAAQEFNDHPLILFHWNHVAYIAWAKHDYAQAAQICQKVLEEVLESSETLPINVKLQALIQRCWVPLSQCDLPQARIYLADYLKLYPFPEYWFDFQALLMVGVLAVQMGQIQWGVNVFAAYTALREALEGEYHGYINPLSAPVRSEYEQALAAARAALGDNAFNMAWGVGRAMKVEQVMQYALEYLDDKDDSTGGTGFTLGG